jgi:hypothetical protein
MQALWEALHGGKVSTRFSQSPTARIVAGDNFQLGTSNGSARFNQRRLLYPLKDG